MYAARPAPKSGGWKSYWWLALLPLLCLPCLTPIVFKPDPAAILAKIPLGSKASDLDRYLDKFYKDSKVEVWRPAKQGDKGMDIRNTKFGTFRAEAAGSYYPATSWDLTGELLFYHYSIVIPDDLAPSFVIRLVYIDGILKEKDWGILPG